MNLQKLALIAVALLYSPFLEDSENIQHDLQWVFREKHADGAASPTAIFLSPNYNKIRFVVECQVDQSGNSGSAGNGGITLYYHSGDIFNLADISPRGGKFGFYRGENSIEFIKDPTYFPPGSLSLEGMLFSSIAVTPELLSILEPGKSELSIKLHNELPHISAGQAEPLYQVAKMCAKK